MNTLQIFLGEFWPAFIGVTIGLSVVWLARRSGSGGYPAFIGTKSFTELSGFAKDQQKQLLHGAGAEALRGWHSFIPVVLFATFFAAGVAFGRTLPKVTTVPDSFWVHAGFAALFAGFGGWLAARLEVRYLRPFLKASIEKYMLSVPSCRNVARLLLIAGLSIFMSGCGTTLSPVKRKPVQVSPLETTLPSSSQRILFRFENTLPGTPLTETVWDNVAGPFASAKESKQIGFTQDYGTLIPATVAGGPAAGAYVGTQPDYTRIVIPFGRIFQGVFQSGLEKVYPNSLD